MAATGHEKDRKFLRWVRCADLIALNLRYPKTLEAWQQIAIERALRREKKV
jgi:hypothetical protein